MKTNDMVKYPRTRHIENSGIQNGDEDLDIVPFSELDGKPLVCEEKIDGANTGISFNEDADLLLQCRGHFLTGKGDWPEFDQFKLWANTWKDQLYYILTDRYIMYGEWMYALHSVYYDLLPHYFMEFDIYDKGRKVFLSTPARHAITKQADMNIESVHVLKTGIFKNMEEIKSLIRTSHFISPDAKNKLLEEMKAKGFPENELKALYVLNETPIIEGLYIKWEEDGIVQGRYKFVRQHFVQTILNCGEHWTKRPTIPNRIKDGCNMFAVK